MSKRPIGVVVSPITMQDRTSSIAAQIRYALDDLTKTMDAKTKVQADAKEAVDGVKGTEVNQREITLGELSVLSYDNDWTMQEIKIAAPLVTKGNVSLHKSMATFLGEAKAAMHPDVREVFSTIVQVRDAAWQAEVETLATNAASPAPIKKAFSRKYHFLLSLLRQAADGVIYETVEECVSYAQSRDPDYDPERIAKRLTKIREDLETFYADFPVEGIQACVSRLAGVGVGELVEARAQKLGNKRKGRAKSATVVVVAPDTSLDDALAGVLSDFTAGTASLAA
jgi:hypothetical protein